MGGGGPMRAAAKAVAGFGLPNAGLRSGLSENISAARKAIRHSTSSLSSAASVDDTSRLEVSAASQTPPALAWELDDWEFDGYVVEEEQPRLVFGPAPTIEETKEATSELSYALDKMYFSPSNSAAGSFGSVSNVDKHRVVSDSESLLTDTKACVVNQTSDVTSVPNQAFQAFKLLRESPVAQNVVASIASDPNVWSAVLENEALKEYLQSEKECMNSEEQKPLESSEDSVDNYDTGSSENVFMNVLENIKLSVAGLVNNLSGFFQDWFGGSDVKTESGPGNPFPSSTAVGGSLFGLAIMVIMVVIMKRG